MFGAKQDAHDGELILCFVKYKRHMVVYCYCVRCKSSARGKFLVVLFDEKQEELDWMGYVVPFCTKYEILDYRVLLY